MFLLRSIYGFPGGGSSSRYVRARKRNPEQPLLGLALLAFPVRPQRILSGEVGSTGLPECVCWNERSLATDERTCTQNACARCSLCERVWGPTSVLRILSIPCCRWRK